MFACLLFCTEWTYVDESDICLCAFLQYVTIMRAAMDITQFDKSPQKNSSWPNSIYFVIYLVIGALFVTNLFLGFIVDGFHVAQVSTSLWSDVAEEHSTFFHPSSGQCLAQNVLIVSLPSLWIKKCC